MQYYRQSKERKDRNRKEIPIYFTEIFVSHDFHRIRAHKSENINYYKIVNMVKNKN
jgi:hypothetical protein